MLPSHSPASDPALNVANMRAEYTSVGLNRNSLAPDPIEQFRLWFDQACSAQLPEPNAMSLATAWKDARPSVRTVLLKQFDHRGFVFFTNLESKKARQLAENPHACLLFPWLQLERQVIIHGTVEKTSVAEAIQYFVTRPLGSRLAAWASPQSSAITSRKLLEMKWEEMKRKFANGQVPLPSFWGGYRLKPAEFEFWQGRANRLHDRFRYSPDPAGAWTIERLAP
jgi:pyridoxamine 5'-phosphate oxidase